MRWKLPRGSEQDPAVLLPCSSSYRGISLYLYLQLKIDRKLYLAIYTKTFVLLLVLKLTVRIMFYYHEKLNRADEVFTPCLTVCCSGSTGSPTRMGSWSLEQKTNPLPNTKPNHWVFASPDQIIGFYIHRITESQYHIQNFKTFTLKLPGQPPPLDAEREDSA